MRVVIEGSEEEIQKVFGKVFKKTSKEDEKAEQAKLEADKKARELFAKPMIELTPEQEASLPPTAQAVRAFVRQERKRLGIDKEKPKVVVVKQQLSAVNPYTKPIPPPPSARTVGYRCGICDKMLHSFRGLGVHKALVHKEFSMTRRPFRKQSEEEKTQHLQEKLEQVKVAEAVDAAQQHIEEDTTGKYMLRQKPVIPVSFERQRQMLAEQALKPKSERKFLRPFPKITGCEYPQMLPGVLARLVETHGELHYRPDGEIVGVFSIPQWREFLQELLLSAVKIADALGVPNRFTVRGEGKDMTFSYS